jgi:hypothetical protein
VNATGLAHPSSSTTLQTGRLGRIAIRGPSPGEPIGPRSAAPSAPLVGALRAPRPARRRSPSTWASTGTSRWTRHKPRGIVRDPDGGASPCRRGWAPSDRLARRPALTPPHEAPSHGSSVTCHGSSVTCHGSSVTCHTGTADLVAHVARDLRAETFHPDHAEAFAAFMAGRGGALRRRGLSHPDTGTILASCPPLTRSRSTTSPRPTETPG